MFKERKRIVFFGLPFSFTIYNIEERNLMIETGFFNKTEENCYMYKIIDVTLKRSLFERVFKLGTIICNTGDTTTPVIKLQHIRNYREIEKFIWEKSEEHKMERRTINTLDLDFEREN